MSKHETGTTVNNRCSRGEVRGGASPSGTAAVSKHETGTVIKQTTGGALQLMVAFALRGGGGGVAARTRIYLTPLCPGRREVRPRISTPRTYTITSKISPHEFKPAERDCHMARLRKFIK